MVASVEKRRDTGEFSCLPAMGNSRSFAVVLGRLHLGGRTWLVAAGRLLRGKRSRQTMAFGPPRAVKAQRSDRALFQFDLWSIETGRCSAVGGVPRIPILRARGVRL